MTYIIHPDMELWDFMLDGIRQRNDIKEFPISRYSSFLQKVIRKLFPNKLIPSIFVISKKLRKELKKLNDGDRVIVSAYYVPILHNAIRQNVASGISINLWLWNPVRTTAMSAISFDLLQQIGVELHTFDKKDAEKYDMIYHNSFYNMNVKINSVEPKYDFYFLGAPKNRNKQINETKDMLKNYRCLFVTPVLVRDFISYKENLEHIKESRCIIEILQRNQYDITLRPLEALSFKKKLLTNNVHIKEYSFYNPNNIFIIGVDDNNKLQDFLDSPFEEIDEEVLKQYDINTWINSFKIRK